MAQSQPEIERDQLKKKLLEEGRADLAGRLAKCGQPITLRCLCCDAAREVKTRCDQKWCPYCARAIAARTADRYARIAAACASPLLATFTTTHSTDDGPELIRHVRRSHTKLRRLRWWRKCVAGGVVAYEVARADATAAVSGDHGWHPHAHCILDARWLSVTALPPRRGATRDQVKARGRSSCIEVAEQWSLALGRRGSVHVRRIYPGEDGTIDGAIHEVLKYSVKGSDLLATSEPVGPLIDVLARTRLVASWGSFYRHESIKRRRGVAPMCPCGASDWLPQDVCKLSRRIVAAGRG